MRKRTITYGLTNGRAFPVQPVNQPTPDLPMNCCTEGVQEERAKLPCLWRLREKSVRYMITRDPFTPPYNW